MNDVSPIAVSHDSLPLSASPPVIRDAEGLRQFFQLIQHAKPHRLGEYQVATRQANPHAVQDALAWQQRNPGKRLGEILIERGQLAERQLERALHTLMGVPTIDLASLSPDPSLSHVLSSELARRYHVVPVMFLDGNLVIASEKLLEPDVLQNLNFYVRNPIALVLADGNELQTALFSVYDDGDLPNGQDAQAEPGDDELSWQEAERRANLQPTVRLVNSFIEDAIRREASDIHLRPGRDRVELLYRIHGTLLPIKVFRRQWLPPVVSRLKVLARLNIAERRLPQDGHLHFAFQGQRIDLRLSIIPSHFGESVVIRILNKNTGLRTVENIGFSADDEALFRDLITRNAGIVLVTGPTGSGKTTTLYAALQEIRKSPVNVITVEDPVEYELPGMCQIQLLDSAGFSFPQTLRHILRHDPDVIMIGEMRDEETCKIALESALTGHLVLSTLHTNDAPGAILRLLEIGIAPSLIKSTVIGVIGQRLVRRNCAHCRVLEEVTPLRRRLLKLSDDETFWRGQGCEHCHQTGYSGRLAIYELFAPNDAVRERIAADITSGEMRELALAGGMRPMLAHGLEFARRGDVSLDEVYRACQ